MSIFAKRVKERRIALGLTQEEIGSRVGDLHQSTIAGYESLSKKARQPDIETMVKLSRALETSVAYLVGETDDPRPIAQITRTQVHPILARVKDLAKSKGVSYTELLTQTNITEADIAQLDPDDPDPHKLWPVAAALGTSMAYLSGETESPRPILTPGQAAHNQNALYDPGAELVPEDIQDLERAYLEIGRRRAERRLKQRRTGDNQNS